MGTQFATRHARVDAEVLQEPPRSVVRVGRADDPAEARADRFAQLVAAKSDAPPAFARVEAQPNRIRRSSTASPAAASTTAPPSRVRHSTSHDDLGGTAIDRSTEARIRSVVGGERVPERLQRVAEDASGRDLNGVRIHRGTAAADLSASLQATAFTLGPNIFLGADAARPGTAAGDHLLAHELGHVVESAGAPTVRRLFGSDKKKQAKLDAKAAAAQAQAQAIAAAQAEQHPAYPALLSAVLTVEQRLKWLRQDKARATVDGPELQAYAKAAARDLPGTEKDPGFGPLKRRLRIVADETQLLLDEVSVAESKRKAGDIYMGEGRKGNFKALTPHMKADEFNDQTGRTFEADQAYKADLIAKRKQGGESLGLSKAEQTAITVFTAQDYKYINPATQNSRSWMLANRDSDVGHKAQKKPKSQTVSQKDDQFVSERMQEGSLHAGMAMAGLQKMPVFTGPTYRGEAYTKADFLKKFKLGSKGKVTCRTPTMSRGTISSASKDANKARQFAYSSAVDLKLRDLYDAAYCLVWEYELTNGRDIEGVSANASEKEVATLPGATFQVVDVSPYPPGELRELSRFKHVYRVRAKQVK